MPSASSSLALPTPDKELQFNLWHNLGIIYRDRLKQADAAAQAFKLASELRPEDATEHKILAELYGRMPDKFAEAVAEYARHFRKPSVIEATCEDYRAGASVDLEHDRADRESGRRLSCPLLVLWGRRYLAGQAASPLDVWRPWAGDVREVALECGHFLPEEQPDACAAALFDFVRGVGL